MGAGEVLLLRAVFLLGKPPAMGRTDPQRQEWSLWLQTTLTPAIPGAALLEGQAPSPWLPADATERPRHRSAGQQALPSQVVFDFSFSPSLAFTSEEHFCSCAQYVALSCSGCQVLESWQLANAPRGQMPIVTHPPLLKEEELGFVAFCFLFFVLKVKLVCLPGHLLKLLVMANETCAGWFVSSDGSRFPGVGWGARGEQ